MGYVAVLEAAAMSRSAHEKLRQQVMGAFGIVCDRPLGSGKHAGVLTQVLPKADPGAAQAALESLVDSEMPAPVAAVDSAAVPPAAAAPETRGRGSSRWERPGGSAGGEQNGLRRDAGATRLPATARRLFIMQWSSLMIISVGVHCFSCVLYFVMLSGRRTSERVNPLVARVDWI